MKIIYLVMGICLVASQGYAQSFEIGGTYASGSKVTTVMCGSNTLFSNTLLLSYSNATLSKSCTNGSPLAIKIEGARGIIAGKKANCPIVTFNSADTKTIKYTVDYKYQILTCTTFGK